MVWLAFQCPSDADLDRLTVIEFKLLEFLQFQIMPQHLYQAETLHEVLVI
jgi:hypothetical protein